MRFVRRHSAQHPARAMAQRARGSFVFGLLLRGVMVGSAVVATVVDGGILRASAQPPDQLSSGEVAHLMAETPRALSEDLAMAPNGLAVAYVISTGSVQSNNFTVELMLQRLDTAGRPLNAPTRLDTRVNPIRNSGFNMKWCPDSSCISYFKVRPLDESRSRSATGSDGEPPESQTQAVFVKYDLSSGQLSPIPVRDDRAPSALTDGAPNSKRRRIETVGTNYEWSPSGRFIAFTAPLSVQTPNLRTGKVQPTNLEFNAGRPNQGLFVLDVSSGRVEQRSPDTLHIVQFDWAPDESMFAVNARSHSGGHSYRQGDLSIIDYPSGNVRTLVLRPGMDCNPTWSPDGKWIAFATQHGEAMAYGGWAAVVPATGGTPIALATFEDPTMSIGEKVFWTQDSRGFYFTAIHHMTTDLAYADLATKRMSLVAAEDHNTDDAFTFSDDRRRVAFSRQSIAAPAEVYYQALPDGSPQALTSLAASFSLANRVRIDRMSWRSRDGKFTVHGLLVTPRSAWRLDGSGLRTPLPALVFNNGGPAMMKSVFDQDGYNGGILPLAARGYAVLAPNTRGREGYGLAFGRGLRDGRSYGHLGYQDMLTGVDMVVQKGIADPERLGIYGHSYGANLTLYAITQTDRFRAAAVHESTRLDLAMATLTVPGSFQALWARDVGGIENPLDPTSHKTVLSESPYYHLRKISTPALLQFGANAHALTGGIQLFAAFLHLKVPVEYVVYESGHGVTRPAQMVDELTRLGDWFDFWLKHMPYPDAAKARSFDEWRAARGQRQKTQQP
jgi:dipeptidyl aminopeptidase/acylaminoacyl peptidase